MKTTLLVLLTILLQTSCSKDNNSKNQTFSLPPETQTGANTFGVTINGKVYVPRDPTGTNAGGGTGHGMSFFGGSDESWNEIEVKDGASTVGFQMFIHIQNLQTIRTGIFQLKQSNFHSDIDSTPFTHIYFKIWDNAISNYVYYGSIENQGEINVTRFDGSLTTNWILSGNFRGKFVRYDDPDKFIEISDGRFDLNLNTLPNAKFP